LDLMALVAIAKCVVKKGEGDRGINVACETLMSALGLYRT
jgi:hypothetical protein